MEIADIIADLKKLFQLAKKCDCPKQIKSIVFLEKKMGESSAAEIDTSLMALRKLKQILKPSERNRKLILTADNLVRKLEQLKDELALKAPFFDPATTKPYRQRANTATLTLSDTTGRMIEQDYNLQWAQTALEPWISLVRNIDKEARHPFFFGRTAGQRLNRMAYHYAHNTRNHPNAEGLVDAVTTRGVEKANWSDVANYWIKSMGIYRDGELLKLQKKTLTKEEEVFWDNFNLMQLFLHKDWMKDVDRPDYRHKPIAHTPSDSDSKAKSHSRNADIDRDLINRRACKYLLHQLLKEDRLIVYSLDGIDQTAVAAAAVFTIQQDGKEKTKVPVCTTELRELFRLWDYFKGHVLFTEKLAKIDPPWVNNISTQKDWAYYALHLARKILINEEVDGKFIRHVALMLEKIKEKDYAEVIRLYHSACPSLYGEKILETRKPPRKISQQSGQNEMLHASREDYIAEIAAIISQSEKLEIAPPLKSENGISYIIHEAAKKGNIEILKTCLWTDVDPNLQDEQGDTPLIVAARAGNTACLKWLMSYGAQRDLSNHAGHTAVNIAAASGHIDCLKFLIEEAHCTVDIPAQNGTTALFVAAWEGHSECVAYLLSKGADVNVIALKNRETPLTIAAAEDKPEVMQILLDKSKGKIDINYKNKDGQSALSIASAQDSRDCIALLKQYDAISESSEENRHQFFPASPKQQPIAAAPLENSNQTTPNLCL